MSRGRTSHKDFDRGSGMSTQALVPWINKETGERWTAPSGGYSPREGSGWEREGASRKKPIVTKPTRDLNTPKEPKYGRWQDAELPVWSGGSRDFDERSGTYRPGHRGGDSTFFSFEERERGGGKRPGHRDDDYKFTQTDKGRNRERRRPEPKRDWWQEPRRDYRPEKTSKERRMELLTGGTGTGGSSYSDRHSLLTGRGLSSNEDRMSMLTGRSDPPKEEWQSQYGGRREYDPQDREFNRQFNTEPTNNRDVRSWFPDSEPSRPVSKPSNFPDDVGPGKKYPYGKPDPSHPPGVMYSKGPGPAPDTNQRYDDSSVRERLRALEGRPQTGGWQEDRIKALENRPQSTGGNWDEARIKALESRSPIVNQPTVDLSGVEGRLSQLEGKGSDWQEDRIRAIEGRKPQDLSGIQGRLSELESKGPSWQEDRVKQLEGSRSESKSARNLLDQRIATLENYYKNDPPPADSTGNRYEDKLANLNKMWEQQGSTWDQVKDTQRYGGTNDDRAWSRWGKSSWTNALPDPYVNQLRDLNREYNKPTSTAIIKGREYKSYGPKADARLSYLDQHNIHEDEYLGRGDWENQYGQKVSGWGKGDEDRYFTSQSGLEKDSEDYKKRFSDRWGNVGKDYAYYG